MGNQLNIKGEEAYALASELAELTGESMTAAVIEAVRMRLERERRKRDRDDRLRGALAIAAEMREHMGQPLPSSNHDWLYDDTGLPA